MKVGDTVICIKNRILLGIIFSEANKYTITNIEKYIDIVYINGVSFKINKTEGCYNFDDYFLFLTESRTLKINKIKKRICSNLVKK